MSKYAQFDEVRDRIIKDDNHRDKESFYWLDYWQSMFLEDMEEILKPVLKESEPALFRETIGNMLLYFGITNMVDIIDLPKRKTDEENIDE